MIHIHQILIATLSIALAGCLGGSDRNRNDSDNSWPPVCGGNLFEDPITMHWSDYHQCSDLGGTGGHTCESLGWEGGELGCTSPLILYGCRFDTSQCYGPNPCGNGVIDPGEVCDGTELGGVTCGDLYFGHYEGPLFCMPDCRWFNDRYCVPVGDSCGNGVRDMELFEHCDNGERNSDTEPGACRTNCMYPICGDGVIDQNEECDDGLENSNTKPDGCRFFCIESDYEACYCRRAFCGDQVMDTGEECDGRDLGGLTCEDHGFGGGSLACNGDCTVDTSLCIN